MSVFLWRESCVQKTTDDVLPDSVVFGRKSGVYPGICGYQAVFSSMGVDREAVSAVLLS